MEPKYLKWLREHKPAFYKKLQADMTWAAQWRDKRISELESENDNLISRGIQIWGDKATERVNSLLPLVKELREALGTLMDKVGDMPADVAEYYDCESWAADEVILARADKALEEEK